MSNKQQTNQELIQKCGHWLGGALIALPQKEDKIFEKVKIFLTKKGCDSKYREILGISLVFSLEKNG